MPNMRLFLNQKHLFTTNCCVQRDNHSAMTHPSKRFALAVWFDTPVTTPRQFWTETILHWAADTWHWRINNTFKSRKHENMSPSIDRNGKWQLLTVGKLLQELYATFEPGAPEYQIIPFATHCCAQRTNYSVMINPWKRIGTSWIVPHAYHNSKPILDRNDSPLGCLQLALAYKYHFWMKETYIPCIGRMVNGNCEQIASRAGSKLWTGSSRI